MLPRAAQKLPFTKVSEFPPYKLTHADKHKISKFLRPLSVSPSAAIQKPKKAMAKKVSPFRKLYSKRPNAYIMKLEKYCRESSLMSKPMTPASAIAPASIELQPKSRKQKKSTTNLDLLKKLKKVAAAGVRKTESKTAKQKLKRKLKKRLQMLPSLDASDNTSITYNFFVKNIVKTSQHTPSKSDAPISPIVSVSTNSKLRGPPSKFAYPDYDASEIKAHNIEDPVKYKESVEAYLEMQMEIARASDPEMFDDPDRDGWSPETLAGKFIIEVSSYRRKIAHEHTLAQERKLERELEREDEQMQLDPVDTFAPSKAPELFRPATFNYGPPLRQVQQEAKPMLNVYHAMFGSVNNVSAPARFPGAAATPITQQDTPMQHDLTYTRKTHPQVSQGKPETPAKKALAPPPGARKAVPMNLTRFGFSAAGTPQNSSTTPPGSPDEVAKKALMPPPGARRATPIKLTTLPLMASSAPQSLSTTPPGTPPTAVKKGLMPPPGARRAIPMNLITIG